MYYLAQGITHRGVGGAYISAEENHPPCARISPSLPRSRPGLPTPRATFAPFHRTLNPPSGSSLSSPAPSNHPPRARARSHPSPFTPHPSLRCTTAVPDILCSLYPPSRSPVRSHPPKTPLTPTLPIPPFSLLYTHTLPFPPPAIPLAAASIRRSDSTQRQPPAEGGCALLAPESSRPRPHRGRGDGTKRAEGRAGVAD